MRFNEIPSKPESMATTSDATMSLYILADAIFCERVKLFMFTKISNTILQLKTLTVHPEIYTVRDIYL